jgi:predicted unusual protein kinase regulating ubiquinone biosynthesis (AarF/ABC1/UbiB family)
MLRHLASLLLLETAMILSYTWAFVRGKLFRPLTPEQRSALHRRNARRFVRTASKLKGANVKLGQFASMQAHVLPIEYIEELKALRDAVQPTNYGRIARLIEAELGQAPEALFAQIEPQPIAAASMAQVHVAKLKSGEKVVVKVLHPGLERSVAIDMALMRLLFRGLKNIWKRVDLDMLLRESEEPLRRELDLTLEAQATEQLRAALLPLGVTVPRVHRELSSRRVLTLEFIEGVNVDKVAQLEQWSVDRAALAGTFFRSFMHQVFVTGTFHADPHPGNTFCTPDGRLALLDFGMVKELPDHVRQGLLKELFGSFFNNPKLYVDGLIEKGALGESDRAIVEERARIAFADPAVRALVFDHGVADRRTTDNIVGLLRDFTDLPTFRTPSDNLMFMRALGIVIDVCKELAPEVSPSQIAGPVLAPILSEFIAKHPQYFGAPAAA